MISLINRKLGVFQLVFGICLHICINHFKIILAQSQKILLRILWYFPRLVNVTGRYEGNLPPPLHHFCQEGADFFTIDEKIHILYKNVVYRKVLLSSLKS